MQQLTPHPSNLSDAGNGPGDSPGDPADSTDAYDSTASTPPFPGFASWMTGPLGAAAAWSLYADLGASAARDATASDVPASTASVVLASGDACSAGAALIVGGIAASGVMASAASVANLADQPFIAGATPGQPGGLVSSGADPVGAGGSSALYADLLREDFNLTGAGVKVGVISGSFDSAGVAALDADEADGALPSTGVTVLSDISGSADEGRAMLELVHQIAPGAQLYFASATDGSATGSDQAMANSIAALQAAGCNIIIDDVAYYDEPMFQEGVISQAIDSAVAKGVMYFTAAGNDGTAAYEAAGSAVTPQVVTLAPGADIIFDLQWSQPLNAPSTTLGMTFTDGYGDVITATEEGGVDLNGEAETLMEVINDSGTTLSGSITISNLNGGPTPGLVKLDALGDGQGVSIADANTGTLFGHAEDPNAVTVAAANSANDGLEYYTSSGAGTEWLFNSSGSPIDDPISKVNLTGVDGIETSVGDIGDFFGTSAAAPTVGAVAALLKQLAPSATDAEIENALEGTAVNLGYSSALQGSGEVNALAAADALVLPTTSVVGAQERTVLPNNTFTLTSLFSTTELGAQGISEYQIYEGSLSTLAGTITNGSTTLQPFQNDPVTSLSGLTYTAGTSPGMMRIWVQAEAYGEWGNWTYVDMNDTGDPAPTVSLLVSQEDTVRPNQSFTLTSLFSANEASGDSITKYQIYLGSLNTLAGSLTDSGAPVQAFAYDTFSSLSGLTFTSSGATGNARLWVEAYADNQWSNWAYVDMNDTGYPAPTVSLQVSQEQTAAPNQSFALSSLFSANEASGDPITQYQVYVGSLNTLSGGLSDNGSAVQPFQYNTFSSLSGLSFTAGDSAGNARIWVQAYADSQWSNWTYVDLNDAGPEVTLTGLQEQTIRPAASFSVASLFSLDNPGNLPVTEYQIYEGSTSTTGGVIINSSDFAQPTFQYYTVSSLSNLTFLSGGDTGSMRIWVQADVGGQWTNWNYVDLNMPGPPQTTLKVSQEDPVGPNQTISLASLFSATEPTGDAITQYQIYEGSPGTPVGSVSNGGTVEPAFQYYTVASLSSLTYNTSAVLGTTRIWVQAMSDAYYGNWAYVDLNNTGVVTSQASGTAASAQTSQLASQMVQAMASFSPPAPATAPVVSAPPESSAASTLAAAHT
jgi:hypothetical protein